MVKYEKEIKKELLPGETIIDTYKQSDSFVYENPLYSVLNWLLILSFFINAGIIVYLNITGFTQSDPYKTSMVGAVFFLVNILLYLYSISPAGNKIRSWKIPGFKYDYDYSHSNIYKDADDDSDVEIIYLRSRYTTYFAFANGIGAIDLYLLSIHMPTLSNIYRSIICTAVGCAVIIILTMIWRRTHRKIAILTDRRIILYRINSGRCDYLFLNKDTTAYKRADDYTVRVGNTELYGMMTLPEALIDEYQIGPAREHAFMHLYGFKKCEELYKKLK